MKKAISILAALAAITVLAQFTTALSTSVRITGTPTADDRRWMQLIISNENTRRINSGDPTIATNLLPDKTDLRSGAETALSNVLAGAIRSYMEQAANQADARLTRDQWLKLKAAIEDRMATGVDADTILTDLAQ